MAAETAIGFTLARLSINSLSVTIPNDRHPNRKWAPAVEKLADRNVKPFGGIGKLIIAFDELGLTRNDIRVMGADCQHGSKPRSGLLSKRLNQLAALLEERPIIDAPTITCIILFEPCITYDPLESDILHETIFEHKGQRCGLHVER